ncbi:MAG: hypothetical protein Kow0013_21460 [Pararhodobacter sp.]
MSEAAFLALGETLTKLLTTGDFALYRTVFRLPLTTAPRNGTPYTLHTEAELEADFALYRTAIIASGITDIVRRVRKLVYPDDHHMVVDCEMNILRRAERVVQPFMARFHLVQDAQDCRIHRIESALGHIRWTLGEGSLDDI